MPCQIYKPTIISIRRRQLTKSFWESPWCRNWHCFERHGVCTRLCDCITPLSGTPNSTRTTGFPISLFQRSTVSPQTLITGWMWSEGWTPPSRRSRCAFILERIMSVKLRLNWIPFECDPFSRASWWNCKKRWNQKSLPLRWSTSQTGRTTSCLFFFVQIFFAIMADVPKGRIQSSTSIMSCPN